MNTYKHLSLEEREKLYALKQTGLSLKKIAKRLDKSDTTLGRELRRNAKYGNPYIPCRAQRLADRKGFRQRYKAPLKSPLIFLYVRRHLREDGWTPQQIAGRLPVDYPGESISHETIYRFVYGRQNKDKRLWEYLPRKQAKRRKQHGRTTHRSHIPQRVSIHERPDEVNNRVSFGHWEGDTVEGKGHKDGVHTEAERVSRKFAALKVAAITSEEAIRAQKVIFKALPSSARQSTTLDNGKENHLHYELKELGMTTYFAIPTVHGKEEQTNTTTGS